MEKYCKSCGRVFDDLNFKICPYCGSELDTRYGRQPIPRKLRHEVFKRDGYRCRECGASKDETSLEIDHILPVAKGGTNDINNLQTLCRECNRMKHTDEWVGGETDLEVAQNELENLEEQLKEVECRLKNTTDEDDILDYKFLIKKLKNIDIPKIIQKIEKLSYEDKKNRIKLQKQEEEQQRKSKLFKKLFVEIDYDVLTSFSKSVFDYFSLPQQSLEHFLKYLINNYPEDQVYSFFNNSNGLDLFLKNKKNIYLLNADSSILILLKDGSYLTSWEDVKWEHDQFGIRYNSDIVFISENLSDEKDLSGRYKNLKNLKEIELSNISNKANNLESMFLSCESLERISLKNFDVSNVKLMSDMFFECGSLKDISDLSDWDVAGVKSFECMFAYCGSLKNISALKNWKLPKKTNVTMMFAGCNSITDFSPLNNWSKSIKDQIMEDIDW